MTEVKCHGCDGKGYRWRDTGRMVKSRHGGRGRFPVDERYTCTICDGAGTLPVQSPDGPWTIRLNADNTVAGMQLLRFKPHDGQRDVLVREARDD